MPGSKIRKTCGCGRLNMQHGINKQGIVTYKPVCYFCRKEARSHKKDFCEKCGITVRLEVDHIDGNKFNNKVDNLQTLCNDCHIKKTIENKDGRNRYA
jgi:hypothetical protein